MNTKNTLQLYDYFRSSAAFRVRIALNLKNLSYDSIPIHLINNGGEQHTSTYKKINPQALIPTLQDGEHTITQSMAIIEYLDEVYPEIKLLPADPYLKSLVRSFALTIVADTHPLNNLRVLNYLQNHFKINEEEKNTWYKHWIHLSFSALENRLTTTQTTGKFCFGETPTLADVCLVPQMFNARRFSCDLTSFPTLVRIDQHCQTLKAFAFSPAETVA